MFVASEMMCSPYLFFTKYKYLSSLFHLNAAIYFLKFDFFEINLNKRDMLF